MEAATRAPPLAERYRLRMVGMLWFARLSSEIFQISLSSDRNSGYLRHKIIGFFLFAAHSNTRKGHGLP